MKTNVFFTALERCERVMVAGAGGGFDVYAGLPLALALMDDGKQVHLANLSFAELHLLDRDVRLDENIAQITPALTGLDDYFPERALAVWLATNGLPSTVFAFPQIGVQPLRAAYRTLVSRLGIDAIVLVDGGTDILMRGDESGLGTPAEDMSSLAALAGLDTVSERLVACIGFGIDAYHGVNHRQVLENIADLDAAGAYLGAFFIPSRSREAALYRAAVAHAQALTPMRPSIVNGQISAALDGHHGDVRFTRRTRDSQLFVNPLMAMYFTFDLVGLAKQNLYLDRLDNTFGMRQVWTRIEEFREQVNCRIPRTFPH